MNHQALWDQIDPPKEPVVSFYQHPIFAKTVDGINTYILVDYIRLKVRGSNDSVSRRVEEKDKIEHRQKYEDYRCFIDQNLNELSAVADKAQERTLNEMGFRYLEELAHAKPLPIYDHLRLQAIQILEIKNGTNQDRQIQHNHEAGAETGTQEKIHKEENPKENLQKIGFSLPQLSFEFTQ